MKMPLRRTGKATFLLYLNDALKNSAFFYFMEIRRFYSKNKPIVNKPLIIFFKCVLMPNGEIKEYSYSNKTFKRIQKDDDIYVIEKNETTF